MQKTKEKTQILEVRPGVFFPIPRKERGLKLFKRRINQLFMIIGSKRFAPHRDFEKDIIERYAQPKEQTFYHAIALSGLYKEERYAVDEALKSMPENPSALVIGSGTGREAFALKKLGFNVIGVDTCPKMVETAKRIAHEKNFSVDFTLKLEDKKQYDLVYTTFSLTNHLPYRAERIKLLKQMKKYMGEESILLFGGYFRPIKNFDRFWWAHYILKFRWFLRKKIEKGTTAISHLGHHNDHPIPILFHFYQSNEEIKMELKKSGFNGKMIETPPEEANGGLDNFWIAKKRPT